MRRPANDSPPEAPKAAGALRRLARFWWVMLLLPVAVVGALVAQDRSVGARLDRAEARLRESRWEAALAELAPVTRTRLLSLPNQRRAALLLLRLGEDRQAYSLLAARPLRPNDPADAPARELAARCYTAANLQRQAEASQEPGKRLKLAQAARKALPEAPRVLEWLVREEVLAMSGGMAMDETAFERDYAALRRGAPSLADRLKRSMQQAAEALRDR